MDFQSQACSKLILAGEHLALYGYDALVIPNFDYLTKITFSKAKSNNKVQIHFNKNLLKADTKEYKEFYNDLDFYTDLLGYSKSEIQNLHKFNMQVDLPHIGIGLGASASFAVAMIKILAQFKNLNLTTNQLLDFALAAEKKYHGNPSGIDHTTIIYEQPILFKGATKEFTPINIKFPEFWSNIEFYNTGKPNESTKEMVAYVSSKLKNFSKTQLANLNQQIPDLIEALNTNNIHQFIRIINTYGEFLEQIPICTKKVITENNQIRQRKGAAKICGAGGITNGSGICLRYKL